MGPKPLNPMPIPTNRPEVIVSYVDRDEMHFHEVAKLRQAVVAELHQSVTFDISIDKIAEMAEETKTVATREISITKIMKNKFVIFLPEGLAADTFILATLPKHWEDGFYFQKWDQTEGATLRMPKYKVLLEMHGIPPHLYREKEVVKALSQVGMYLGTVAQADKEDASVWTAVVATKELEEVPYKVAMVAHGHEHPVVIKPIKWVRGDVYKEEEMPKKPRIFQKLEPIEPTQPLIRQEDDQGTCDDEGEHDYVHISIKALMEIVGDRDIESLPKRVQDFINGNSGAQANPNQVKKIVMATTPIDTQSGAIVNLNPQVDLQIGEADATQQGKLKSIICGPQTI